ncbi:MAG: nodulation protein NfeD, partial [Candidatus Hodarchaeota archaeon]
ELVTICFAIILLSLSTKQVFASPSPQNPLSLYGLLIDYFLELLFNPIVSSLLLIIGIYALFVGIKAPGWFAEIAGILCLFLALISFGVTGMPTSAILCFVLGVTLLVAELKTGIGILAVSGGISIIIGTLFLFSSPQWILYQHTAKQIREILFIVAIASTIFFEFLVFKLAKTRILRVRTGAEALVKAKGVAITDLYPQGEIRVLGEYWRARTEEKSIMKGDQVEVVSKEGLVLIVKALDEKA